MRFFTSDTHFGHANVIKFDNRPFANIEEHDEELVRRWNAVVKPGDVVCHLGHVGWHKKLFDVGTMLWNYRPISWDEVAEEMQKRTNDPGFGCKNGRRD